eukprot:6446783-Heterocapsa_arctica.AAC.1
MTEERSRRLNDRARVNQLIGTRPFPSSETRLFKGFIAGDSGCQGYHSEHLWSFKRVLNYDQQGGFWEEHVHSQ